MGATFEEIWQALEQDSSLSKQLVNTKGEKRLGVLQGISTRIKSGKLPGLAIVKQNGKAKWYSSDSELDLWIRQIELFVNQAEQLSLPQKWQNKEQEKIATGLVSSIENVRGDLLRLKAVGDKAYIAKDKVVAEKPKTESNAATVKKPTGSTKAVSKK